MDPGAISDFMQQAGLGRATAFDDEELLGRRIEAAKRAEAAGTAPTDFVEPQVMKRRIGFGDETESALGDPGAHEEEETDDELEDPPAIRSPVDEDGASTHQSLHPSDFDGGSIRDAVALALSTFTTRMEVMEKRLGDLESKLSDSERRARQSAEQAEKHRLAAESSARLAKSALEGIVSLETSSRELAKKVASHQKEARKALKEMERAEAPKAVDEAFARIDLKELNETLALVDPAIESLRQAQTEAESTRTALLDAVYEAPSRGVAKPPWVPRKPSSGGTVYSKSGSVRSEEPRARQEEGQSGAEESDGEVGRTFEGGTAPSGGRAGTVYSEREPAIEEPQRPRSDYGGTQYSK